jgi:hypothetical protein
MPAPGGEGGGVAVHSLSASGGRAGALVSQRWQRRAAATLALTRSEGGGRKAYPSHAPSAPRQHNRAEFGASGRAERSSRSTLKDEEEAGGGGGGKG